MNSSNSAQALTALRGRLAAAAGNIPSRKAIGQHMTAGRIDLAYKTALHREFLRGKAAAFEEAITAIEDGPESAGGSDVGPQVTGLLQQVGGLESELDAAYEQVRLLEEHRLNVARAVGIYYSAEGHGDEPGPDEGVLAALRSLCSRRDHLEDALTEWRKRTPCIVRACSFVLDRAADDDDLAEAQELLDWVRGLQEHVPPTPEQERTGKPTLADRLEGWAEHLESEGVELAPAALRDIAAAHAAEVEELRHALAAARSMTPEQVAAFREEGRRRAFSDDDEPTVDDLRMQLDVVRQGTTEEVAERDRVLSRLRAWSQEHGTSLTPQQADTYGEGMRDAKQQVAAILSGASERQGTIRSNRATREAEKAR